MSIVKAKCTNCETILQVDVALDAAICEHCGMAFIVKNAINKYDNTVISDISTSIPIPNANDFIIRAGTLEKYMGASVDVVIPRNVNIIGYGAFEKCVGLRTVTIPETVTVIGDRAFLGCSAITHIIIPIGITKIGEIAFGYCSRLTEIIIPDSVIELGKGAFEFCENLKEVLLSDNIKTIERDTFYRCKSLIKVKLPAGLIRMKGSYFHDRDGPNDSYNGAFTDCEALQSIYIPNGVKEIGDCTFYKCSSLTTVNIPDSVKEIGHHVFGGTNLRNVDVPESIIVRYSNERISSQPFSGTAYEHRFNKMISAYWQRTGRCVHCGCHEKNWLGKCKSCGKKYDI